MSTKHIPEGPFITGFFVAAAYGACAYACVFNLGLVGIAAGIFLAGLGVTYATLIAKTWLASVSGIFGVTMGFIGAAAFNAIILT